MEEEKDILFQALNEDIGVEVELHSGKLDLLKARFYRARSSDPDLAVIQIRTCPHAPASKLWLIHPQVAT